MLAVIFLSARERPCRFDGRGSAARASRRGAADPADVFESRHGDAGHGFGGAAPGRIGCSDRRLRRRVGIHRRRHCRSGGPYAAPMGRTDAGAVYILFATAPLGRSRPKSSRLTVEMVTILVPKWRCGRHARHGRTGADQFGRTDVGAAYVFARTGTTWNQQAKLTAFDGGSDDQFGFAVALDGDIAVVGARGADVMMRKDAGAAYVFGKRGPNWAAFGKLTASDA